MEMERERESAGKEKQKNCNKTERNVNNPRERELFLLLFLIRKVYCALIFQKHRLVKIEMQLFFVLFGFTLNIIQKIIPKISSSPRNTMFFIVLRLQFHRNPYYDFNYYAFVNIFAMSQIFYCSRCFAFRFFFVIMVFV